jgi:BirA family biotin operon repressor/biotin-[acetyl-CoA-carboxylase] ligase
MRIVTDCVALAEGLIGARLDWRQQRLEESDDPVDRLSARLIPGNVAFSCSKGDGGFWESFFVVERAPDSQFDALAECLREGQDLPGRVLCFAATGDRFHGFKERPWIAQAGNIHLSAFLKPESKLQAPGVAFVLVSVASVIQAIDSLNGLLGLATVKWVNDILIDGAKVGGVLARVQTQGEFLSSAVLGIGLNVEMKPRLDLNPFVPRVASLAEFLPPGESISCPVVFRRLAFCLGENSERLLKGEYLELLDLYRTRSTVLGRKVVLYSDSGDVPGEEIARGVVESIEDDLSLRFFGESKLFSSGRLVLE